MATWKKVIISGSDISQLNNDVGYVTTSSQLTFKSFATASFNGVDILANSETGSINFTSGSNGLNITANAGTNTLDFSLDSIPNSSLENSNLSLGNTSISLGDDVDTIDGVTLTDTQASGSFTGSFTGTFVGTTDLPDLTDGNGIVGFTYDGSNPATISVEADGSTLTVGTNGVKVSDGGITETQLNTSIAGTGLVGGGGTSLSVDLTELTVGLGLDTPDATTLNLDLTEVIASDAANRVLTSDGDGTLTAETNFTFDGSTLTVTGDQTVTGNLTVQGTASFQNTENLVVADRFVLFASGSTTTGDGGIVIQQATQDVGELFGYDSGTSRWALDSAFDASTSAFTPEAFMSAVVEGADADPDNAPARYNAKGNIFVGTDEGIWIYS